MSGLALVWNLMFGAWCFAARPPNILLILSDDQGYADLGCQGSKDILTPHIDSLAKHGVRFTNGYISSPVCSPSRAGLLAGRGGTRFGIELNPGFSHTVGLPPSERTMAEYLQAAGYKTGIFGKWHLGFPAKMRPTARGFDEFFGFLAGAHSYTQAAGDHDPANVILRGTEKVRSITYLTDDLGREAVAFIDKNRDEPWFVYLAFNAPHGPFEATEKYKARFPDLPDGRRTIAAMIAAMDDNVGAVLAKLREHKREDNTLIFFLSDNGAPRQGGSNQPFRGLKAQLLEGGIRIPFIAQWKGKLPAGKVDDRPVISLDILPTVLAAANLPIPEHLDGVNLLPYLTGEKANAPARALCWRYSPQRAIRVGDWKLLQTGKKTELFHLATDIGEKTNLAGKEPAKVKELEAAYQQWNARNRGGRAGQRKEDAAPVTVHGVDARSAEPPRGSGVTVHSPVEDFP